jgi:hypothetical protein
MDIPTMGGYVGLSEAARILGVSYSRAHQLAQEGKLPSKTVPIPGTGVRLIMVDLEAVKKRAGDPPQSGHPRRPRAQPKPQPGSA